MALISNIIWVDPTLKEEEELITGENKRYLKKLKGLGNFKVKWFNDVNTSINFIKSIKYEETFIIVNRKFYPELIQNLIKNYSELYIIPIIIVFTQDKEKFKRNNKDIINNNYYLFGGIYTKYNELEAFLKKSSKNHEIFITEEDIENINLEYIDNKDQLILPILYKILIEITPSDNIKTLNENLYKNYGKKSKEIEVLFNTIKNIDNIPYELLSKYYSKIYYDNHSKFYKKIKEKKNEYLAYTKVLYEGIKLKSLPVASNNVLYRVSLLSREFISKVENYIIKKNKDLPAAILFIRTFLTFTKNEIISNCFLNSKTKSNNLCKVLFILEKDNSIDYTLSTHVDFKNKALFFPFSCFEIKSIIKKDNSNDKYEIQLSYLGKYLNNLKNDEKIFENQIPDSDFPKEIIDFGLIEEDLKSIK